jgi:hypothetical protein
LFHLTVPPWKKKDVAFADAVQKLPEFNNCRFDMKSSFHKRGPAQCFLPSSGFSSLEEELLHLQRVTQESSDLVFPDICFVNFPQFFCDKPKFPRMWAQ